MAYTHVQSTLPAAQSGTTATVSLTGVTGGNALILAIRASSENRSILSVSDGTNTWVDALPGRVIGTSAALMCWYVASAASGAVTVTVTFDAAATAIMLCLAEYSGLAASPLDVEGDNIGTGIASLTVPGVGSLTPAQAGELCISWFLSENTSRPTTTPTSSVGAVFTDRQNSASASFSVRFSDARLTATTATTISQPVTGGNSSIDGMVVLFKEAAGGGGGTVVSRKTLHSVGTRVGSRSGVN